MVRLPRGARIAIAIAALAILALLAHLAGGDLHGFLGKLHGR